MSDWLPATVTTGALATALWLARKVIITRLTHSVQYEFEAKLESIRSQLRESEERIKADLRAKEAEIATLRSGALTALANRQVAIDKRRLEAVDQLWTAVVTLARTKAVASLLAVVNFEKTAARAEREPKLRTMFEAVATGFNVTNLDLSGAEKARPFLSPMVWAVFSALRATSMHSVMQLNILKSGLPANGLIKDDEIAKLIKTVLPHYTDLLDKYGSRSFHLILDALETKLLQEVELMMKGGESDKAAVAQAAEILRLSIEAMSQQAAKGVPGLAVLSVD